MDITHYTIEQGNGFPRPIELGYKIAKAFANKSPEARRNAEMLGLMVNDPNIEPAELSAITAKTLVMAGSRDLIKREHTERIAGSIHGAALAFIEGDHFIAGKNPSAFNENVLRFLREEGGTPWHMFPSSRAPAMTRFFAARH